MTQALSCGAPPPPWTQAFAFDKLVLPCACGRVFQAEAQAEAEQRQPEGGTGVSLERVKGEERWGPERNNRALSKTLCYSSKGMLFPGVQLPQNQTLGEDSLCPGMTPRASVQVPWLAGLDRHLSPLDWWVSQG